jgi:hypothetical protein
MKAYQLAIFDGRKVELWTGMPGRDCSRYEQRDSLDIPDLQIQPCRLRFVENG